MKRIFITDPHRQKHFDFFNQMNHPHYNICADADITALIAEIRQQDLPFMPVMLYLTTKVANEITVFRQRIRGNEIIEHDVVHPSIAVNTTVSEVFSFCEVEFDPDFRTFFERAINQIERMRVAPSFEDEAGRDDYLFMSSIPWISFTSIQHAMQYHPHDSIPRIVWGKYFETSGKVKMPLSIHVHHGLVDGRHVGEYFERFESLAENCREWLQ